MSKHTTTWTMGAAALLLSLGFASPLAAQAPAAQPSCQPGTPGCPVPPQGQRGGQPAPYGYGQPGYGQPAAAPGYGQPGYGQPAAAPGYGQPGYGQAPSSPSGEGASEERKGFYFGATGGFGYLGMVSVSDRAVVLDFHALGLELGLQLGYAPKEGFAFGIQTVAMVGYSFAGELPSINGLSGMQGQRGLGLFVAWFPEAGQSGLATEFAMGVLGGGVSLSSDSMSVDRSTGTGMFLQSFFGHELPLSKTWSMALGLRFRYGITFNGDVFGGDEEATTHQALEFGATFRYL